MGNTENINGIEVYTNKIQLFADDYILRELELEKPEDIKAELKKTPIFKGMLKHIYLNVFKPDENTKTYNNIKQNSNLNYDDIETINKIWGIYTKLCYKYNQHPTLLNFGILTGIGKDTFTDWSTGHTRQSGAGATSAHCRTVKSWMAECEAAAYDVAMSGNPGGMFILKANYGYTEGAQRVEVVNSNNPQISAADIAARITSDGVKLPELPELD